MTLKDNGKISNKEKKNKQHKKYRDIKCDNCGSKIDISEKIELGDFDKIGNGENYVFYCNSCGESTDIIKL